MCETHLCPRSRASVAAGDLAAHHTVKGAAMIRALSVAMILTVGCGGGDAGGGEANNLTPTADAGSTDAGATPRTCQGLNAASGNEILSLTSGGRVRSYRLHVPPSYDPTVAMPVVLNFHGLGSNAAQQEAYTGMSSKADEAGFIAVHPDGVGNSWNGGYCCGDASSDDIDDIAFVAELLDQLDTRLCIDNKRIYATGMSNGGFISHRLGCDLTDRIAAIAPVAGTNVTVSCSPTRPIPVLHFHGTADTTVRYSSAPTTVADWARRNGCQATAQVSFENGDTTCESYTGCRGDVEATLCSVEGAGHVWPGGLRNSAGLDATDGMWDFFSRFALP
jgi:polyhydroxybutyrate depolymerase